MEEGDSGFKEGDVTSSRMDCHSILEGMIPVRYKRPPDRSNREEESAAVLCIVIKKTVAAVVEHKNRLVLMVHVVHVR